MRGPVYLLASVLILLTSLGLSSCGLFDDTELYPDYNVVFVLADTLRADHLGAYGYERDTSPFLDQLAASNIHFENVRSQAACTFPSVNSMLTSKNVFTFQDPETRPAIPPSVPTLAEMLREEGYRTMAVSASPIVRDTPSPHNPEGGFGSGFDVFDEFCHWRESTCVTRRAIHQLEQTIDAEAAADSEAAVNDVDEPFFLYLHYMDPHDPYVALKEHRGLFAGDYEGGHEFIAAGDPNPIDTWILDGTVESRLGPSDIEHLIDLYDEEIYSLDAGIRLLFRELAELGVLERTIFVFASDHGEAFLEHGKIKHCFTVYDNETRVPLILRLPEHGEPVRRSTWVENLDIVPTLLDYLGIDAAPYDLEGRSLRPVIESAEGAGEPATESVSEPVFSAMASMRSVNDDRYKLVLDYSDESLELYDLASEAGETEDLAAEKPEIRQDLLRDLRAWIAEVEKGSTEERLERAQEIEDELRALGYIGN